MAYISLGKLGEISVPDIIDMRPFEQRHSMFIGLHTEEGGREGGREREGRISFLNSGHIEPP